MSPVMVLQPNNPALHVRALEAPLQPERAAPKSVARVEDAVTERLVEVALVVEPRAAEYELGKST